MSTKITSIYDEVLTIVETTLGAGFKRLPNPYVPEKNPSAFLVQGYGIQIGSANNPSGYISGFKQINREISVVITREVFAKESDASLKATAEKQLMEDIFAVAKAIDETVSLSDLISGVTYISDTGVNFLNTDKSSFLVSTATFELKYMENLGG